MVDELSLRRRGLRRDASERHAGSWVVLLSEFANMQTAVDGAVAAWSSTTGAIDGILRAPPAVTNLLDTLTKTSGVGDAEIRMFLALLTAYFCGFIWRQLGSASLRHPFSCVMGIALLQFVYGAQWIHLIICSTASYTLMAVAGPKSVYTNLVFVMVYLSCGHIYRMVTDFLGWTVDWTLPMMVVVQKLSALAFNYYDGAVESKLPVERVQYKVDKLPSLLEFYSFILFPASITMGPGFEFQDYKMFADGEYTSPPPYFASFMKFVKSLGLFAVHTLIAGYLPLMDLMNNPGFLSRGYAITRWYVLFLATFGYRVKYYFAWYIAEGAIIMSGLGYNGTEGIVVEKDGEKTTTVRDKWNRVEAMDIVKFELTQSIRDSSNSWNKTTNLWIRRYVYDRFGSPPYNIFIAYMTSAVWHGFYPGYYMFFISGGVLTFLNRKVRRQLRPHFLNPDGSAGPYKGVYDFFCWVCTIQVVNYFILSFIALSLKTSLAVYKSLYWTGHIVIAIMLVIFGFNLVPKPKYISTPNKKAQ